MSEIVLALPESWRGPVIALFSLVLVAQVLASQIVGRLPAEAIHDPTYGGFVRALHTFGHARFRDEFGTLKYPGATFTTAPSDEASARRAYEGYASVTAWKNYRGDPMPQWADLPPTVRAAWIMADAVSRSGTVAAQSVSAPPPSPPDNPRDEDAGRSTLAPPGGVVSRLTAPSLRSFGGMLVAAVVGFAICFGPGCKTLRNATPGVPVVVGCGPYSYSCEDAGPGNPSRAMMCSPEGAWWNTSPRNPDGSERFCALCRFRDAGPDAFPISYCADAGAVSDATVGGDHD